MFDIPLHKLIIHFPIALTLVALIYDAWAVYSKQPEMHKTSYGLTLWAAVSAFSAMVTGLQLEGVTRIQSGAVTGHAIFGISAGIIITTFGIVRYSARVRERSDYPPWWLILEIAAAALVAAAAITGEKMGTGSM